MKHLHPTFSAQDIDNFVATVWQFYASNKRAMPWRSVTSGYWVTVSECMLQQTQVERVIPKFEAFVKRFVDFNALAGAELREVLEMWQGLGYNRRAKFIWQTAQLITDKWKGKIPYSPEELAECPGIGVNTAGAIIAYTHNHPTVFIETNIRRVFLHHWYPNQQDISDAQIMPLVQATLDTAHPREWYWALMDYGTHLKKTLPNPNRRSKHYSKQSRFEGSNRQVRAAIIRMLTQAKHPMTIAEITAKFPPTETRIISNITDLVAEQMVQTDNSGQVWV